MTSGESCGPRVGVGGVAVVDGRVVLIRRGKPPFEGSWSIPGGTVEWGESLDDALAREMWEETSLRVRPRTLLVLFDRIQKDRDRATYHYVIADYWCEVLAGSARAGSDARELALVAADELSRYDLAPDVLAVVRRGLQCWHAATRASPLREAEAKEVP